jgi:hypothetical protein
MTASVTDEITITEASWTAIADGAGDVIFTAHDYRTRWAISDTNAPSGIKGHVALLDVDVSLTLVADERLWVKGPGTVTVTAEVPV